MVEPTPPATQTDAPRRTRSAISSPNAVLFILMLVYVLNFIDRNILSILAEEIKADLGLTDSQLGFLYGTAFAVFYGVFGLPLGRLADFWIRKKLIAISLAFWSLMTVLSGTARSLVGLGVFRICVGIGEAGASPAAFSMLCDTFPPRSRARALSFYASGVFIGIGLGTFLGGWVIDFWKAAFPTGNEPFGLAGWQVAFFVTGLPGLLLAAVVWRLREPIRGRHEGGAQPSMHPTPFREFAREVAAVIPPLSMWSLMQAGANRRMYLINGGVAAALACWAALLVSWLGNPEQWVSLAIGFYACFSWAQRMAIRNRSLFRVIFGSRALVYSLIGFSSNAFVAWGFAFWVAPYFLRAFDVGAGQVGLFLGLSAAGGWIGVNLGGVLSDRLVARTRWARVLVGIAVAAMTPPAAMALLFTESIQLAYVAYFFFMVISNLAIGPAAANFTELVPPEARGTSSALYLLSLSLLGHALGPYAAGVVSDAFGAAGASGAVALRWALAVLLPGYGVGMVFLLLAGRAIGKRPDAAIPEDESRLRSP